MNRRRLIAIAVSFALSAASAAAESAQDAVIGQLSGQGFSSITVSRTLLGRVRIIARSVTHRREIVLNPRTGEILRDYWVVLGDSRDEDDDRVGITNPGQSGGNDNQSSGGHGEDDDNDDDDDDDDDDDSDDEDEDDEDDDDEDDEDDDEDDDDDEEDEGDEDDEDDDDT